MHEMIIGNLIVEVLLSTFFFGTSSLGKKSLLKLNLTRHEIYVLESNDTSMFIRDRNETYFENDHGSVSIDKDGTLVAYGPQYLHRTTIALKWEKSWSKIEFDFFTDGNVMINSWLNATLTKNITGKPIDPYASIVSYVYDYNNENLEFSLSSEDKVAASASIYGRVTAFKNRDIFIQIGNETANISGEMFAFQTPRYIVHHTVSAEDSLHLHRIITLHDKITGLSKVVLTQKTKGKKVPLLSLDFDDTLLITAANASNGLNLVRDSSDYVNSFILLHSDVWSSGEWRSGWYHGSPLDFVQQAGRCQIFSGIPCLGGGRLANWNNNEAILSLPQMLLLMPMIGKVDSRLVILNYPYFFEINATHMELHNLITKESFRMKLTTCRKISIFISYDMKVHTFCWMRFWVLSVPISFDPEYPNEINKEPRLLPNLFEESEPRNDLLLKMEYTEPLIHFKIGDSEIFAHKPIFSFIALYSLVAESKMNELRYFDKEKRHEIIVSAKLEDGKSGTFYTKIDEEGVTIACQHADRHRDPRCILTSMAYNSLSTNPQRYKTSYFTAVVHMKQMNR